MVPFFFFRPSRVSSFGSSALSPPCNASWWSDPAASSLPSQSSQHRRYCTGTRGSLTASPPACQFPSSYFQRPCCTTAASETEKEAKSWALFAVSSLGLLLFLFRGNLLGSAERTNPWVILVQPEKLSEQLGKGVWCKSASCAAFSF